MKKYFLPCLVVGSLLIATGCGKEEEQKELEAKVLTCAGTKTVQKGVEMDLNYKVTYKGDYVTLVETNETVTSDNKKVLETFKEQVEELYSPYKDVEHYEYDVKIDGKKLVSTTNINYEKVDTNKLIEIDENNKSLIKDGKIKLDDIKLTYELLGVECK